MAAILRDLLVPGLLVITPNLRLRRYLEVALAELAEGGDAPRVLAMREWVAEMYLAAMVGGSIPPLSIADAGRSYALMAGVVDADSSVDQVVGRRALVDAALTAAGIADLWGVEAGEISGSAEADMFSRWLVARDGLYEAHGLVSYERAVGVVAGAVVGGGVFVGGDRVVLYAFDDLAPAYAGLMGAVEGAGVSVEFVGDLGVADRAVSVGLPDKADQYLAAARWAAAKLAEHPAARIGVVCPELAKDREVVLDSFARVLEPAFLDPSVGRYTLPFNISAGVPLSVVPVIRAAINILAMGNRRISVDAMSSILLSPFIGGSVTELDGRMAFDAVLRSRVASSISVMEALSFAKGVDGFAGLAAKYAAASMDATGSLRPSQWAVHFSNLLAAMGWPGERELDSQEFQAVGHWNEQLDALASLDGIIPACGIGEAMDLLSRLCARTVFQPETCDSPIQILGVLEAAGLGFDHLWIADMNDDVWPQAAKPTPLLPYSMQRDRKMPHGSAERELEYGRAILARLMGCSADVVLSYAVASDDREMRRSPLLACIEDVPVSDIEMAEYVRHIDAAAAAFTVVSDVDRIPAFGGGEPVLVRGGVGVLEAQAKCPFQAAAKYRLGAVAARTAVLGLSYAERGIVIHDALEHFWQQAKSQQALLEMSSEEVAELIDASIGVAFTKLKAKRADIGSRLLDLERDRLRGLLAEWVQVEMSRAPFRVVGMEAAEEVVIGGLKMLVRRDRVDELSDGRTVSVEYKTGAFGLGRWGGARPESSQTPIYIASDKKAAGAVIGLVKKGEARLMGFSSEDDIIASDIKTPARNRYGLPEGWDDLRDHWSDAMERLAHEFCSGTILIDPKGYDTCRKCDLAAVCRVAH